MNTDNTEVGLCISGDSAVVTGPKDLVANVLDELGVRSSTTAKLGQSMADVAAGASGIAAMTSAMDGRWFQMTAESHNKLTQLANYNPPQNGLLSGVLRANKGKIDSFLNFQRSSGLNPIAMSNVAALAGTLAVRSAVAQVEQLVQEMDVKLDQLLQDNRAEALGNVQGMTQILSRTYEIFEETGCVSDTAWDQIAGHATALAQSTSHCKRQIDSMTASLNSRAFADRADAARYIADGELRLWLAILAASHANQKRLEALELARLEHEDGTTLEVYLAASTKTAELEDSLVANQIGALLGALQSSADVSDFHRVRSPQKSHQLLDSVEETVARISRFEAIYGLEDLQLADTERETWRKSVADLAKTAGGSIATAAKRVPNSAGKVGGFVLAKGTTALQSRPSASRKPSIASGSSNDDQQSGDE